MSRNTNEEWERRKWYLVRSLFDNIPLLSPIQETQEQSFELKSPTEAAICRPFSPLPDLIIEKEPNRHDDPEEYYQALEKKIKKIYRKLFLKRGTSRDTSIEDAEELILRAEKETTEDTIKEPEHCEQSSSERIRSGTHESTTPSIKHSESNDSGSNYSSSDDRSDTVESNNSSCNSSAKSRTHTELDEESNVSGKTAQPPSILKEDDTSSSMNTSAQQEIIVIRAEVHDADSKRLTDAAINVLPSLLLATVASEGEIEFEEKQEQSKNTVVISKFSNTDINDGHDHSEGVTSSQSSDSREEMDMEVSCASIAHIDACSLDEPETMRRHEKINLSMVSAIAFHDRRSLSTDFELLESPKAMEEAEGSSVDFSFILGTSTPKLESQGDKYSKRRILSEISNNHTSSPKRNKVQNLSTQTSFSTTDDESNWQEIRTHFFEGNPCIYKLCTCSNHVCC